MDDGPKLAGAIEAFLDRVKQGSSSVEGQSHHAEILYRYGEPEVAYTQIMDLTREDRGRREYPEVSYSVVGAVVTGLMGITVEAESPLLAAEEGMFVDRVVRTLPGLAKGTAWAELRNLPVRANEVTVRHEGRRKTVLTNVRGPALIWQAAFPGSFENLRVDGAPVKANATTLPLGRPISWVRIVVGAGVTARVETTN